MSQQGKNPFGGGNPGALYVPMSETEQEVLERLIASDDLEVHVVGWGIANKPAITFGDLRIQIKFRINFERPDFLIAVHYLDLELKTRAGTHIFGPRRYPVAPGGEGIMVKAGMYLDYAWDIAIKEMNPDFVKMVKPSETGLTSRRGNMKLDPEHQRLLQVVDQGSENVQRLTEADALAATKKAEGGQ